MQIPIYTLSYAEFLDFSKHYSPERLINKTDAFQVYLQRGGFPVILELLERIIKYAFDNVGNTFSGKNVADYFKRQQRKIDINTVYNYLNALECAYILHRVSRYDIKGKE